MKIFESTVKFKVEWTFSMNGQVLRSSVVAGHQGEIEKSWLTVYNIEGHPVLKKFVGSRKKGMDMFVRALIDILSKNIL